MAIAISHTFVSAKADGGDTSLVQPSNWNAAHSLTGFGTGVETALAVNVGSAGAIVVNGGALGTPSGGTLTNCTGLPAAGVVGTAAVLTANTFTEAQTITGGTVTASTPLLNITQTWNNAAVAFQGVVWDFTVTAANAIGTNYFNIKKAGVSQFQVGNGTGGNCYVYATGGMGSAHGPGFYADIAGDTESRAILEATSTSGLLSLGTGSGFVSMWARSVSSALMLHTKFFCWGGADPTATALGRLTYTASNGNPAILAGASKGFTLYTNDGNTRAWDVSSAGTAESVIAACVRGWSSTSDSSGSVDTGFARAAANIVDVNNGTAGGGGALRLNEMTAPSAPAANKVYIYAVDNGGKTELMALFPSGVAQRIAIEP